MAKYGRRTKLSPEIAQKITQALQGGATRRAAFGSVGIHEATFYNWMARGEKASRGKFFEFFEAVHKAEAAALLRNCTIISKLALGGEVVERKETTKPDGTRVVYEKKLPPSFNAASWFLARRDPENWGEKISPPGGSFAQNNYIVIHDRAGRLPAILATHKGTEAPEQQAIDRLPDS